MQFNDTQDGPLTDRRTLELMDKVIETEKPDFVLINGDVIDGQPKTATEVKQAINNVVQPMESRKVKWALTFGNHDEDSLVQRHGHDRGEDARLHPRLRIQREHPRG